MPDKNFLYTFKSFLATKISYQVRELYLSVIIIDLATAMVAIFEPIYLYHLGFSLKQILYFFLAVYVLYLLFIPLGAKFARRFGYEKAIYLGTPFWALYFISLYLIPHGSYFIAIAILALVLQKTFYWPGYHADLARFGRDRERGREVGNLMILTSVVYILGPFLGGLVLKFWGFKMLFALVSVLMVVSNIPLLATPERFEPKPFSYTRSFRRLFYKENRRNFFGFLGFGEELIVLSFWPIFIFTVLKDYLSVGSLVALTTFVTTIVLLFVGKISDSRDHNRRSILRVGSVFNSVSWFLRLLVSGGLGVFLVDTLSRLTKSVVVVPMMAMTYERGAGTSVMKTIIFFEMSLIVGKLLAIIISLLALQVMDNAFAAMFIIAGLMSLLYSLVKYEPIKINRR